MTHLPPNVDEYLAGERFWVVVVPPAGVASDHTHSKPYDDFDAACQAVARMNKREMNPDMIVERVYQRKEYANVSVICQMRLRHGGVVRPTLGLKRHASSLD